jgi:crossover junction endodeoxyribonuclease RuvC
MKRVLGIDPGLASTGWGVVDTDGSRYSYVDAGVIRTPPSTPIGQRLATIYDSVRDVIDRFTPNSAGVEQLYFAKNATSGIPVAHARGVVFLALAQADIPTGEYPPQAIKKAIVGVGRADKSQVQELVRVLLGLAEIPKPDHASDALAAAICHIATSAMQERTSDVQ